MFYCGSYTNSRLLKLWNYKECKTCYKYTEYEYEDIFGENPSHRIKKSDAPLIIEADYEETAYKILDKLHEDKFKDGLEIFRIALEEEFENRGNDIIGLSPLGGASIITKEGKIVEIPRTYIFRPDRYDAETAKIEIIKTASAVMKKFGKDFSLVATVKGNQYFLQMPPKENIRLVSRSKVNLWPGIQPIIQDTREDWHCRSERIDYKNFLKLGITYRTLLREYSNNIIETRNSPDAVVAKFDTIHNREDSDFYEFYWETEKGINDRRGSGIHDKDFFELGKSNADIRLITPTWEVYCTRDFLFGNITIGKTKLLKCQIKGVDYHFSALSSDWHKYMINEIKNQLGSDDWKSYLLLNELEEF